MVKDLIGTGMHCALLCKADAECGSHGSCSTTFGPDNGICVYAPAPPAPPAPSPTIEGLLQLVYGTKCPDGWKELTDLKGQLLAVAPGAGGITNKQPPLGVNETGRVGPHGHAATAKITDPGHAHANTLTDPGHTHKATMTDRGHTHDIADPGHTHGATVTDHGHGHV
jgi:hypothetical protein